jgi:transcriptional antiterminator NusG
MGQKDTKNWYAVFVSTGEEDITRKMLELNLGTEFKILVPKRKLKERKAGTWQWVTRTLLPGYILINGVIEAVTFMKIKETAGVIKLLENEGEPSIITREEIDILSQLTIDNEVIDVSNVVIEGETIQVIDGPLKSLEGIVEKVNKRKGRVKVRLSFFGEKRSVELSIRIVEAKK